MIVGIIMCLIRGVCVATLPSEVAADRSVGFVRFWLSITLNSELCLEAPTVYRPPAPVACVKVVKYDSRGRFRGGGGRNCAC